MLQRSSRYPQLRSCLAVNSDHGIECGVRSRRSRYTKRRESHVVRIPALCSLSPRLVRGAGIRDSYSSFDAYSIRDGVPRQTFPSPRSRISPLPFSPPLLYPLIPLSLLAHSLPSEITAVALTAFSHVPVARVALVVLGNERERFARGTNKREREGGGKCEFIKTAFSGEISRDFVTNQGTLIDRYM